MESSYFQFTRESEDPAARLFCFHCAGGSPYAYAPWEKFIDPRIDIFPFQMSGRCGRKRECYASSIEAAALEAAEQIKDCADRKIYLTGHSMGGVVAHYTAYLLKQLYGIISDKELDIPASEVSSVLTEDTLKEQMDAMLGENNSLIYAILIIAAIICISSLFIAIGLLISENSTNISMLKILGYDNKRISRMLLDMNQVLLIPGIGLGIAAAYAALSAYKDHYAALVNAMLPVELTASQVIITTVFVCICYYGSLYFLKRKVGKVNMAESLMDNRE